MRLHCTDFILHLEAGRVTRLMDELDDELACLPRPTAPRPRSATAPRYRAAAEYTPMPRGYGTAPRMCVTSLCTSMQLRSTSETIAFTVCEKDVRWADALV